MALDGSSSSKSKWNYHVFLNFRGEDTRLGFTDHLNEALKRRGIIPFKDDEDLVRGEVIPQKLLDAIEESLSSIVIISQDYASSTWCLDELLKILEMGQDVIPVFYHVDPSDVRHQSGIFEEPFRKHEENFAENKEKVQKWRDALKYVANLSGWHCKDQPEAKIIEEIVGEVWTKLESKLATSNDGLVGINEKVEDMVSLLRLDLEDVRFIEIWGMGGIGKTTLANAIFKKIKSKFDISCFLANVREASVEGDQGLVHLQNKLLSHLQLKSMIIETSAQGKDSIKNLLCNKKVLLVLDDVTSKSQLENLAGNQDWFGPTSRIIVTTRDKHLLISHRVSFEKYEMKTLNPDESLELFCERAFKAGQSKEDYLELFKTVVEYAGGLPLALEVLGSLLCGRSVQEWKDALIKISQVPPDDILNKLKISYDMLEDEYKTIFLDIACLFKGWYKDKVIQILHNCGLHPTIGINVLIEKSLVTCDGSVLGMHDLLEEMGKTIVSHESIYDPGECSRLWSMEDINKALTNDMGTKKVQGIVLKPSIESYEAHWQRKAFSKMCNLRLLIILCNLHLPLGLKYLPISLKVLIWMRYPLKTLPLGMQLDELVLLQMCNSKIRKLWSGTQDFKKLKVIDLSNSKHLLKSPNISGVPNLEELFLDGCRRLREVHRSVGQHKKLTILSLTECQNLKLLPRKMEMDSLKRLFLSGCSKVERLPDFGENMECVLELNLMDCTSLVCLPCTLNNLKSLKRLNISGCSKICWLPNNISENKALEDLDLSGTSIREVNSSLVCLENLKRLSFKGCGGPVKLSSFGWNCSRLDIRKSLLLPRSVLDLSSLQLLDLSYCNLSYELIPKDLCHLSSLERLKLNGNKDLELPTDSVANLSKLRCLELEGCMLRSQPVLPPHARLYPRDFDVKDTLLDPLKVWKLFEPRHSELFESQENEWTNFLYTCCYEVPPRFHNQNFFPVGQHLSNRALITVDIPNSSCGSGEWWGIAVLVALEPLSSAYRNKMRFYWSFEAPHPEAGPSLYLCCSAKTVYNNCYVLTVIMNDNYIYVQRHPRRDHKRYEPRHISEHWKPEFSENSTLRVDVELRGNQKIKECEWRVLSRELFFS